MFNKKVKNDSINLPSIGLCLIVIGSVVFFTKDTYYNSYQQEAFSIEYPLDDQRGPNFSAYAPMAPFNTNFDSFNLVASTKQDTLNVPIEYYTDKPLLNVSDREVGNYKVNETVPELLSMPQYHHSKLVDLNSPISFANNYRLLYEDSINHLKWVEHNNKIILLQNNLYYTGWAYLPFDGLYYYSNGYKTEKNYDLLEFNKLEGIRNRFANLLPHYSNDYLLLSDNNRQNTMLKVIPRDYSILYKNPNNLILTAPPGINNSSLLTTTEKYVDMPMEVIEELVTPSGKWLHVNIGYNELGWIKKDPTLNDYVVTYYSERNLLDNISFTMKQEMYNIDAEIGASFVNISTMAQTSVNNHKFIPASTQKIYILGELYREYAQGILSPTDEATLYEHNRVSGAGVIQGYPEGTTFTLDALVDYVTSISDNTAANILITMVKGGENINPYVHQMGLEETFVTGKYYYFDDTYFRTTPADAAKYFAILAKHRLNGDPYDSELIQKFGYNTHTYIRSYLWGVPGWNKSGTGTSEQNDVATFQTDLGDYTLAIYTTNPAYYKQIPDQVGLMSYKIYQVYQEIRSQLYVKVDDVVIETGDTDYSE